MTISHRTRSRSTTSSVVRENTSSSHNEPSAASEQSLGHLRGCADLPPTIPNEEDRPLIEPQGKSHWTGGEGRTPASVLTCLLKTYHPGLVEYKGKTVVARKWKHYEATTAADAVSQGFWQRFRFNLDKEVESREHVGACCSVLLGSIIYYARITATMEHFREVEKRTICDKLAGQFYLEREEYAARCPTWCKQDCWDVLALEWSSPKFKERSDKNHANRYSRKFKPHKRGSNSIATIRQKLSKKLGRQVCEIEAWVHTHRGSNPEDITSLNTEEATACLILIGCTLQLMLELFMNALVSAHMENGLHLMGWSMTKKSSLT